jgi:hypothetical protein
MPFHMRQPSRLLFGPCFDDDDLVLEHKGVRDRYTVRHGRQATHQEHGPSVELGFGLGAILGTSRNGCRDVQKADFKFAEITVLTGTGD